MTERWMPFISPSAASLTGESGDGRSLVLPVESVVRIRTSNRAASCI